MFNKSIKLKNGFSLIELLIVIFVIMIIATIASALYLNTIKTQKNIIDKAQIQKDGRTVLYQMEKEIRGIKQVLSATNNNLSFLTHDFVKNELKEISYYTGFKENKYFLVRVENKEVKKVSLNNLINDSIFFYYAEPDAAPLEVPLSEENLNTFKILKISFMLNDLTDMTGKELLLSSSVFLRNK